MTEIKDSAGKPSGHLRIEIWRRGRLIDLLDEPNLIVTTGRQTVCRALGGEANRSVAKIGFGEGSTPAAAGNNALINPFYKALTSVTYPTTTSVQFAFALLSSEANGLAIAEFGLLTATNVLYARKARQAGPIYKDNETSLSGTWTINY